ncbi:MAG: hypothetical protein KDD66_05235 [Bdellovibrionales bacterium]|nr:hypothetical protein [Bdellovibrionales bacterium]
MMRSRINFVAMALALAFTFVMSATPARAQGWYQEGHGSDWLGILEGGITHINGPDGYRQFAGNGLKVFDNWYVAPKFEQTASETRIGYDVRGDIGGHPVHSARTFRRDEIQYDEYGRPIGPGVGGRGYSPYSAQVNPATGGLVTQSPYSGKEVFSTPEHAWWTFPDGWAFVQYRDGVATQAIEVKHGADGPYQKPISVGEGLRRLDLQAAAQAQASPPDASGAPGAASAAPAGVPSGSPAHIIATPVAGPWDHEAYIGRGSGWERLPSGTTLFQLPDGSVTTSFVPGMVAVDAVEIFQGDKPMQKTLSKALVTQRWQKLASSSSASTTSVPTSPTSGAAVPPTAAAQTMQTIPADPSIVPVGSIFPYGNDRFGEVAWWKATAYDGDKGTVRANFAPSSRIPDVGQEYTEWGTTFIVQSHNGVKFLVPKNV